MSSSNSGNMRKFRKYLGGYFVGSEAMYDYNNFIENIRLTYPETQTHQANKEINKIERSKMYYFTIAKLIPSGLLAISLINFPSLSSLCFIAASEVLRFGCMAMVFNHRIDLEDVVYKYDDEKKNANKSPAEIRDAIYRESLGLPDPDDWKKR